MTLDIGFATQTPSLPTGGGIGGLGETFAPDLSTGTGTLAVPLDVPHGPNDTSPKLTLRYDSGSPNGPFGRGWSIPLPRLLRSSAVGRPRYDASDRLVLEGSGPLVRRGDGTLVPQVETGDWRVRADGDGYLATDRAGTRFRLGTGPDSRIPGLGGQAWAWLLAEVEDNLGEGTRYRWLADGPQRYLSGVSWGPYELRLSYEPRPDVLRWGRGGFLLETTQRCAAIELLLPGQAQPLLRRWRLQYDQAPVNGASQLVAITLEGHAADGTRLGAPPLRLGYTSPGRPRLRRLDPLDIGAAPPPLSAPGRPGRVELLDWTGTGTADIVAVTPSGATRVWPNRCGAFGPPESVGSVPALGDAAAHVAFLDVDGDGRADLVRADRPLSRYTPAEGAAFGATRTLRRAPAVAPADPAVRVTDIDGTGRPGLIWGRGGTLLVAHRDASGDWLDWLDAHAGGGGAGGAAGADPDGPPTDLTDPRVTCADMTGDGTPDLVRVDGGGVSYWPYLGYGRFGARVAMADPPRLPAGADPADVLVVDVDGDGCADVLHLAGGTLTWWPNHAGAGFGPPRTVGPLPVGGMGTVRVADVTGGGAPSLVWSTQDGAGRGRWFALDVLGSGDATTRGATACGLLSSVDNGLGRTTTITWSTSALEAERDRAQARPWPSRHPVVVPVVAAVAVDDATSGPVARTTYAYHDGRYDGVLRELCGFARVTTHEHGDAHTAGLITTDAFHLGLRPDGAEPAGPAERARWRALRGRLHRRERTGEDGRLFDRYTQEWTVVPGLSGPAAAPEDETVTPRLLAQTHDTHEGAAEPVARVLTRQLGWDADGNVTLAREESYDGDLGTPSHVLATATTYALDPSGRYRQRVARVLQTDADGAVLADLRTTYDGLPEGSVGAAGIVTGRDALALPDALVTEVYGADVPDLAAHGYHRRPDAPGWWVSLGRYARTVDATGLHGAATGPSGATSTLTFDATRSHPHRVVDAFGNAVTAELDLRVNQPTAVVHASGQRSTARYDALARLVAAVEPGDSDAAPTRTLGYATDVLPTVVTEATATAPGSPARVRRQFLDGAGRVVQQRETDAAGEVCSATRRYGLRGAQTRVYLPFRPAGPGYEPADDNAPHTELRYDPLGRVVATRRADGGLATVTYLPGVIEERDAEQNRAGSPHTGALTRRIVDAAQRVVRIERVPAGPGGGPAVGPPEVSADSYDVKGQLRRHVDPIGGVSTFSYDLIGRTIRIVRPESAQVLVLDAAGNPVEVRAGTERVLRTFDAAGRLVAVRHGSAASAPVATYTYHDAGAPAPADAGAHTLGGRLVRIDDASGVTVVDYDARGRLARKTMTPTGLGTFTIELTHRSDDLLAAVRYPGGRLARYRYTPTGFLAGIDGIIEEIRYDLAGRRTSTRFANGVVAEQGYDPLTGWLTGMSLTGPGGPLRSTALSHDLAGNVTAVSSPDADLTWGYGYDHGYRLIWATGAAGTLTYGYDAATNLRSSSALGACTYGAGGAPASVLTGAGGGTYGYDAQGRMTSAPWGQHRFDAEGHLVEITVAGGARQRMTYGRGGALMRLVATAADGTTRDVATPDPLLSIEDGRPVLHVTDGDQVVARLEETRTAYLHRDHLGSLALVTDDTGALALRIAYDPYGVVTGRTGPWAPPGPAAGGPDLGGFGTGRDPGHGLGHGLVLLGSRWYCPALGRFLSPDPMVTDVADPAAWNAYAYCRGNPTSYLDPTGRDFWKIFAAVVATVAIIAVAVIVTVCTFGAAGPGAVALSVGGLSVTWGAVFAATAVGIVAGGVIGGIAAAKAGGDPADIVLGALVGGAVGGWAAFGAAFAGVAVGGALGLTSGTALSGAVVGAVSGTINGAAMGFASGFAGGKNRGLGDIMTKVLVGALVGMVVGGAVGSLSGAVAPSKSVGEATREFLHSTPAGSSGVSASTAEGTARALGEEFGKALWRTYGDHVLAAIAPAAGNGALQTLLVDGAAGFGTAYLEDLQLYLRTHNVKLGPFDFIKSSW